MYADVDGNCNDTSPASFTIYPNLFLEKFLQLSKNQINFSVMQSLPTMSVLKNEREREEEII